MRYWTFSGLIAPVVLVATAANAHETAGYWTGTLEVGSTQLPVGVALEQAEGGAWTGALDSPSQGAFDIPLEVEVADGDRLVLAVAAIGGRYEGRWNDEEKSWDGTWTQGGQPFVLKLQRGERPERAAAPKPAPLPDAWTIPDDAQIGKVLADRVTLRPGAGIVAGVIDKGDVRVVSAGGDAFDAETIFEIGSMTKVFTSLVLAQMVLDGTVDLDDPVVKYLPDGASMPVRNGKQITLRNLSQHNSGLPRLPDNLSMTDLQDPYANYGESDLLAFLAGYELPREIGSKDEYSNLGVGLLGYALARANGSDFETLLKQRLLDPLGMSDTGITLDQDQLGRFAVPHDGYMRPTKPWDLSVLAGAGGVRSTVADMQRFLMAVLDPQSVIAEAVELSAAETFVDGRTTVGLGWLLITPPSGTVLTHSGGTGGFRSDMAVQPATGRAVVVLTNSAVEPSASDIARHLLLGAPLASAAPVPRAPEEVSREEVTLTTVQLDRLTGTYRFGPGLDIVIARQGDQLLATVSGQTALPVFPSSPNSVFYRAVNAEIEFIEQDGKITGARFTQDGNTSALQKLPED